MLKTGQRAHQKSPTRPRTPAHPRRSSSKTQPFMLKTGHCRLHNSLDGLSSGFKACTSALFARHPHDQTQSLMFETSQCRPHNSLDGLSGCFKACTSTLFARYSRIIRMTKRSLSCSKPASKPTGSPRHALRTPAHPRRSSSKTQPLMLKTGQDCPHNSLDGLSGYFKACTSALFARHPHDQTQPFMPETSQDCPRKLFECISNELQSAHRSPLPLVRP